MVPDADQAAWSSHGYYDAWTLGAEFGAEQQDDSSNFSYCAAAAATLHCLACKRNFNSVQGVLQHVRDHASHRDTQEAAEVCVHVSDPACTHRPTLFTAAH
jgi:hypothetical protein